MVASKKMLLSLFLHIWWIKMQKKFCLASLASFIYITLLSIFITLFKNLENNTGSYILSSFYMAATVGTGEGNFDMKMQDFGALKIAELQELPEGFAPLFPHQGSALDLTGDLGGPQTPRRISPL